MSVAVDTAEAPDRKPWSSGMAPAYIGIFLWVAFLDKLGARALPIGGLLPTLLGVVAGSALAYLLLFRVPAAWGFAVVQPLDGLLATTFGVGGARLVPNLAIAIGQVLLFGVGIGYATGWMLDGLVVVGLIEPRVIQPVAWGGAQVPSPLFLTAALVWGTVTALVGMWIVRWIAAIMQFFPVFPAAGLAFVVAGTLAGSGIDQPTFGIEGWRLAFLTTFQWTFGFSALLGITGADWGAASLSDADVRRGGWVSLGFAPVILGSLALLAVVGHEGKIRERAAVAATAPAEVNVLPRNRFAPPLPAATPVASRIERGGPPTLRAAIEGSLDRRLGGVILLIFGLASLAPACYAAHDFGRRLARVGSGFSRLAWTLIGVTSGWFLIVGGWHERTETIFSILGALMAPIAGAMVADRSRQRHAAWLGPRPGINLAGVLAWVVGAVVGLAPVLAGPLGLPGLSRITPAALLAYLAAFGVYRLAAVISLEAQFAPATDPEVPA